MITITIDVDVTTYTTRLFRNEGVVDDWADRVAQTFEAYATNAAPFRTGELANSISSFVEQVGSHQIDLGLEIGAEHATYVLCGTSGVFAEPGGYIPVGKDNAWGPNFPGGGYAEVVKVWGEPKGAGFVAGQEANPFLEVAYDATAAVYRSLAGADFGIEC